MNANGIDLLIVVPPPASTMANGPPLGPLLLEHFLQGEQLAVDVWDANAHFYQWLLRANCRERVTAYWLSRLNECLSRPRLERAALNELGETFAWLTGDYCRGRQFDAVRAGFEWLPAQQMMEKSPLGRSLFDEALLDIVEQIEARQPQNIAFSVMFHEQRQAMLQICRVLRARGFSGLILIGGALVKLASDAQLERDLRTGGIDLAFRFNLYGPQPQLAAFLRRQVSASAVPHASYLDSEGHLQHVPGVTERVKKLAGPLNYQLTPPTRYLREWIYPVLLSEGCYWGKCDFCDYPYLASQDPFVVSSLFRDPNVVREDVVGLVESFGVREIDLISDAVPMGYFPRLARTAGQEFRDRGVSLSCSVRAEPKAKAEHYQAMKECGVSEVTIGVEALSDEVLRGMKKGNTYEDILRAMQFARDAGIRVKANLIFDHPRLGIEHVEQTLERLPEVSQYVDALGVHSFALSPHAPIAHEAAQVGLIVLRKNAQTDHGDHHLAFERRPVAGLLEKLQELRQRLMTLSFSLERRRGAFKNQEVFALPFRWEYDCAVRSDSSANLFLQIPGQDRAFSFFSAEQQSLGASA